MESLTKPRTGSRRKTLKDESPKPAKVEAGLNGVDADTVQRRHHAAKAFLRRLYLPLIGLLEARHIGERKTVPRLGSGRCRRGQLRDRCNRTDIHAVFLFNRLALALSRDSGEGSGLLVFARLAGDA